MSAQAMLTNTFSNQNTKAQRKAQWSQFYFTFSKKKQDPSGCYLKWAILTKLQSFQVAGSVYYRIFN